MTALSARLAALLLPALVSPVAAQAILFDQPTDTIFVPGNTSIGTTFTAEARVMFCSGLPITNSVIFQEQYAGIEDKALFAWAGGIGGTAWNDPLPTHFVATPLAIPYGVWRHIAFVYDGAEQRLYLQGQLIGTRPYSGSVGNSASSAMSIGGFVEPTTGQLRGAFTGLLDTLRISNSARYAGPSFVPPTGDLGNDASTVLLYHFNEPPGSATVLDYSSNAWHGSVGTGFAGATAPTLGILRCPSCAGELETLMTSNNGSAAGGAVYFDLSVAAPLTITGFTLNSGAVIDTPIGLSVYTASGLGVAHTSGSFSLVATDNGLARAAGMDRASRVTLGAPFALAPGNYTMALVANGVGGAHQLRYTNGNGTNQTYADGVLSLALGRASNTPFTGSAFTPRVWNGSIQYTSALEANDECPGAIPVSPGVQGPFSTECATTSTPAWPCVAAGNDVWFAYTHTAPNGQVEINTCRGANFDTTLEVFHGSCTTASSIGCSNDACGSSSRVTFTAGQGKTYNFRVGGVGGARGVFLVEVRLQGSVVTLQPGCGLAQMNALSSAPSGLPEIGSTLTLFIAPTLGAQQVIWLGFPPYFFPGPVPLCPGCNVACDFDFTVTGAVLPLSVPANPIFCGLEFCAQGMDLFAPGGCSFGTITNALRIVIGC